MTAPAPLGRNVNNNHIAKRAPSRHDDAVGGLYVAELKPAVAGLYLLGPQPGEPDQMM